MVKKFIAEAVATMILVLAGCGAAMAFTFGGMSGTPAAVVGIAGAFGISILMLAYSVGPISGGHANPAVTFAKALNKEMSWKEACIYICGQILGAFVGSLLLAMVMWAWKTGVAGQTHLYEFAAARNDASTFWKDGVVMVDAVTHGTPTFMNCMLSTMCEMGLTFLFVLTVLGVTNKKELGNKAGIIIGLALFGTHLVGIPLTGTSVNPARALSALVFSMFDGQDLTYKGLSLIPALVGPLMGAFAAWSAYHGFFGKKKEVKVA